MGSGEEEGWLTREDSQQGGRRAQQVREVEGASGAVSRSERHGWQNTVSTPSSSIPRASQGQAPPSKNSFQDRAALLKLDCLLQEGCAICPETVVSVYSC